MLPEKAEFIKLAENFGLIPVYAEMTADFDTPASAFLKLGDSDYSFLLESIEGGEKLGRYSFLGNQPEKVIRVLGKEVTVSRNGERETLICEDPLGFIGQEVEKRSYCPLEELPPFQGGAVGFVSYDAVRFFENIPDETSDSLHTPDMLFVFADDFVVFDHLRRKIICIANAAVNKRENAAAAYDDAVQRLNNLKERLSRPLALPEERVAPPGSNGFVSNFTKDGFMEAVRKAREYIFAGDIFQVVLSQRFKTELKAEPFEVYRALRALNPSPYMFYLKFKELTLVGSSPEPLVKVEQGTVSTYPIAGTRKRGKTREEDLALEEELKNDEKEKAEHIMLVDLGRNDLGRVCETGTVKVDNLMYVERYSHVMHLVTKVSGKLKARLKPFDALKAVFPAGTVSGAPKIRAMEIIEELEEERRGPYAGAVGYLSYSGDLDTCLTIRTIVIKDRQAYVQAGAGIVADSEPAFEYEETMNKARALLSAVKNAEASR